MNEEEQSVVLAGTPFRALRELGRGGTGLVYAAEHIRTKRQVAVKVVRAEYADNAVLMSRFQREVESLLDIQHEHIVRCYGFGKTAQGRSYIVMPLLNGHTVDDEITNRGPIPVWRALEIARQVGAAMAHAHARGLLHRDLKPANIFLVKNLRDEPHAKVLDFGFVRRARSDAIDPSESQCMPTESGIALGTPRYMAPETALGLSADQRSDVYSFGAVLWAMLTGHEPYAAVTDDKLLMQLQVKAELPSPSSQVPFGIPPMLDALVLRALAKNPSERFADFAELERSIVALQETLDFQSRSAANHIVDVKLQPGHGTNAAILKSVRGRLLVFTLIFLITVLGVSACVSCIWRTAHG